ncbi:MAG: ATP-dependent helicase, partial [Paenibacillaceae bacterium]|nr:ATP-dependent helicase [Paenibacillaceae bacterium]
NSPVIPAGGDSLFILPWAGSKQFRTLERLLKHNLTDPMGLRQVVPMEPYYMVVAGRAGAKELLSAIQAELASVDHPEALLAASEAPYLGKYDEFMPPELVRRAFAADGLDITGLAEALEAAGKPSENPLGSSSSDE